MLQNKHCAEISLSCRFIEVRYITELKESH
jgi:hypothetical protein